MNDFNRKVEDASSPREQIRCRCRRTHRERDRLFITYLTTTKVVPAVRQHSFFNPEALRVAVGKDVQDGRLPGSGQIISHLRPYPTLWRILALQNITDRARAQIPDAQAIRNRQTGRTPATAALLQSLSTSAPASKPIQLAAPSIVVAGFPSIAGETQRRDHGDSGGNEASISRNRQSQLVWRAMHHSRRQLESARSTT